MTDSIAEFPTVSAAFPGAYILARGCAPGGRLILHTERMGAREAVGGVGRFGRNHHIGGPGNQLRRL